MANKTALQESSQALFCALSDYVGQRESEKIFDIKKYPSFAQFRSSYLYNKKDVPTLLDEAYAKSDIDVTLNQIEQFLNENDDWWKSTINISKAIIAEVQKVNSKYSKIKGVNWADILYKRGDEDVMGSVDKLFKIAKKEYVKNPGKTLNFAQRDKWNPADIYFATNTARMDLKAFANKGKDINYDMLNKKMNRLIMDGELIPISLKKVKDDVQVKKMNWNMNSQEKEKLSWGFHGIDKTTGEGYLRVIFKRGGSKNTRGTTFQMRHITEYQKDADQLRLAIELGTAFGGGVGGAQIGKIIASVNQKFGDDFEHMRDRGISKFKQERMKLNRMMSKRYKGNTFRDSDEYHIALSELSRKHVTRPLFKFFTTWLQRNKKEADDVIVALVSYAKSINPNAGRYVLVS